MDKKVTAALLALEQRLRDGEIDWWEMLYVPVEVSFRAGLTPERLETAYHYKLTVRPSRTGRTGRTAPELLLFLQTMKTSTFAASTQTGDMRWGVRFYQKQVCVFSLYVAGTQSVVLLDGKAYTAAGPFKQWFTSFAKQHFSA